MNDDSTHPMRHVAPSHLPPADSDSQLEVQPDQHFGSVTSPFISVPDIPLCVQSADRVGLPGSRLGTDEPDSFDVTVDFGPAELQDLSISSREPSQAEANDPISPPLPEVVPSVAALSPEAPAPASNKDLIRDRYLPGPVIRTDSGSTTYKAQDLRRENGNGLPDLAIKILAETATDSVIAEHKREFAHAQELSHPCILRVFDMDCFEGRWYMTTELIDGPTLDQVLRDPSLNANPRGTHQLIADCAAALTYAHSRGILHCDFHPANVVLGKDNRAKVLGFGVAPEFKPNAAPKSPQPKFIYCSPNVLRGERPDPRDDVFSFACVSYELLTGQHPYQRRVATEAQSGPLQVRRLPGLNRFQFSALNKALSFDRDRRPESIADLLGALRLNPSADDNHVQSVMPQRKTTGTRFASRTTIAASVAAGLFITFGSAVLWNKNLSAGVLPTPTESASRVDAPASEPAEPLDVSKDPAEQPVPSDVILSKPKIRSSPQIISLKDSDITVSSRASMAVIPLQREHGKAGVLQVKWQTVPGSAQPDVDFHPVSSGTARFLDGQSQQVLYVPIINNTHQGDWTFVVRLQRVIGDAHLGTSTAHITIRNDG